jgi:hypothetical protein
MVTTRHPTMADTTFDHVVNTLMNTNVKHHTYRVLCDNDITSAYDIIGFTENMLANFVTDGKDDQGTVISHDKPIPYYHQALMLIIGNFFCEKKKTLSVTLAESDILAATKQEWSQYRIEAPVPMSSVQIHAPAVTSVSSIPADR